MNEILENNDLYQYGTSSTVDKKKFITCRQGTTQFVLQLLLSHIPQKCSAQKQHENCSALMSDTSKSYKETHMHHPQQLRLLHAINPYTFTMRFKGTDPKFTVHLAQSAL